MAGKDKGWSPLVYCWRGGKRSGALATVLDQIGFRVHLLEGGYRAFRRAVVAELEALPGRFGWRVVCGPTGSGKSRLLGALHAVGAQVLDLEALANHRGSVLGLVPGSTQPTQKAFDTLVWHALRRLDPTRPVFVESESKKIGELRVPEPLIRAMRASPCVWLELPIEARVALLIDEYDFFVRDVEEFCARLDALRALRGNAVVDAWQEQARSGHSAAVVRDLLDAHYDPIYLQSMRRNFSGVGAPLVTLRWDGSAASLAAAAAQASAAKD
jgi:tRNA 2-selenouridine synthase